MIFTYYGEYMEEQIVNIILAAFVTIFSIGLLIVSFSSYRKYKNTKLLFVSLVFVMFFIKGILMSASVFGYSIPWDWILISSIIDVLILGFLFIATLKR